MTQSNIDERLNQGIGAYSAAYERNADALRNGQPPMRPSNVSIGPSSNFITDIDARTQQHVRNYVQQYYGVARPRSLSITIPLCGLSSPTPGWFTSINLFQYTRVQGWTLTALGPGQISIDLQVSYPQPDQATAPVLTSIITGTQDQPTDFTTPPADTGTGDTGDSGDSGDSAPAGLAAIPRPPAPFAVSRGGRIIRPVAGGTTDGDGDSAPTDGDSAPTDGGGDGGAPVTDSRYIALNGYTAWSFDTSLWFQRDIFPPSTLHVIINDAVQITMASLGLYLIDLYGKVLPI